MKTLMDSAYSVAFSLQKMGSGKYHQIWCRQQEQNSLELSFSLELNQVMGGRVEIFLQNTRLMLHGPGTSSWATLFWYLGSCNSVCTRTMHWQWLVYGKNVHIPPFTSQFVLVYSAHHVHQVNTTHTNVANTNHMRSINTYMFLLGSKEKIQIIHFSPPKESFWKLKGMFISL